MLGLASQNAAHRGLGNVSTRVCDAGALPFSDATFDAVLCRFGFMFFPNMALAAKKIARVTRIGGRFSAAVWAGPEKNPWATMTISTIGRYVAMQAQPEDAPGLFRCASQGSIREILAKAGFRDISEEEVACPLILESPEHYWRFMTDVAAPVVAGLALADDATQQAIRRQVLHQARDFGREGGVQMRATAIVVAGTR